MAGLLNMNGAQARWNLGANNAIKVYGAGGMVWSKKPVIIANAPYTINSPTDGQADVRIQFGETARQTHGMNGKVNGLPAPAAYMQENFHYHSPFASPPDKYPSKMHHTLHTVEELREKLEKGRTSKTPAIMASGVRFR